jgi:hypothetical protein
VVSLPPPRRPRTRIIVEWTLGILTVGGFVLSLLIFVPRPYVVEGKIDDPTRPFRTSFYVSNPGLITLSDVSVGYSLCDVRFSDRVSIEGCDETTHRGSVILFTRWSHHTLIMDDRYEVFLDDAMKTSPNEITYADIVITVMYQTCLIPITRERRFRFVTRQEDNGYLTWHPMPEN